MRGTCASAGTVLSVRCACACCCRLMANVVDVDTGRPLGGARPSMLLEWGGVRLGLMGEFELVPADASLSGDWLESV